jgi:hypothetical protein
VWYPFGVIKPILIHVSLVIFSRCYKAFFFSSLCAFCYPNFSFISKGKFNFQIQSLHSIRFILNRTSISLFCFSMFPFRFLRSHNFPIKLFRSFYFSLVQILFFFFIDLFCVILFSAIHFYSHEMINGSNRFACYCVFVKFLM